MIWKDYKITIRWLKNEIRKDIRDMFSSASNPSNYINAIREGVVGYFKALKSIFTSPVYGLYWSMTLFIFSFIYGNLFLQIFLGFLVIFAYIHFKLKTEKTLHD